MVDPEESDTGDQRYSYYRCEYKWKVVKLANPVSYTVAALSKLAMAADPWSSCLAVYFDLKGELYIWGLVDQAVHFNTALFHESSFHLPTLGVCQVVASGTADLAVYRRFEFVARLAQESLQTKQIDVFSSGIVRLKLLKGLEGFIRTVMKSALGHVDLRFNSLRRGPIFGDGYKYIHTDEDLTLPARNVSLSKLL